MLHHTTLPSAREFRNARLEETLARVAAAGHEAIEDRLNRVGNEWSVGRMVKATTGVLILGGLALTVGVNLWFAVIPAVGGLMLAQYLFAPHSWLGEVFHGMGYRTSIDIDHERMALKALRGDFRHLPTVHDVEDRDAISRFEDEGGPAFDHQQPRVAPHEAAHEVVEATRL